MHTNGDVSTPKCYQFKIAIPIASKAVHFIFHGGYLLEPWFTVWNQSPDGLNADANDRERPTGGHIKRALAHSVEVYSTHPHRSVISQYLLFVTMIVLLAKDRGGKEIVINILIT